MHKTRFITAGSFIDGSAHDIRKNIFLAVRDGIITAIDSIAHIPNTAPSAIVDFSHCIILPPLVDCSASLARSPSVDEHVQLSFTKADSNKKAAVLQRHINDCHAHGVQGIANNDDITDLLQLVQQKTGQKKIINIRQSSSEIITRQHDIDVPSNLDFLRMNYTGNVEDHKKPPHQINHEILGRIIENSGKKKTVVVANGQKQVAEALAVGCDAIEQGYNMGEKNLQKMAKNNVLWIPSLLRAKNALDGASSGGNVCCRFSLRYVAPGKPIPGAEAYWQKTLAGQIKQLCFAREQGITTAVGTGAGSVGILHGESMVEEMKLFIKSGYSLPETIRCASENGARFFDMSQLGIIKVGNKATFLITRGTAKQLPRKLAYLEEIYIDGLPSVASLNK